MILPRAVTVLLLLFSTFAMGQRDADERPNFIFIFLDDLGLGDLKSYGHPYAITDNLDRVATEGTSFYEFHNTGNVCPTSRAGFMTSRNPSWFPNYSEEYGFMGTQTVTKLLHDGGYIVGHVGKWNIGPWPNGTEYEEYGIDDLRLVRSISGDERGREGLRFDEAIDFVQQNQNNPFYLNLWATAPHTPIDPEPEIVVPFKDLQVDTNLFSFHMQNKLFRLVNGGLNITENMQKYLGIVYGVDLNVGRLLDKLDELNLADNTVVVFTSDNGPALSQTGSSGILRGNKHDFYEGGFVTPFLLRWPGRVPAGRVNRVSLFSALDWLPTICTLAGVDYPKDMIEGEDISDIWLGSDRSRANPIFYRDLQRRANVAMRAGKWKLLDWVKELYDLETDPEERSNIYDEHPDIVAAMLGSIAQWEATLPNVHARLPDEPYPFDPTAKATVIATPYLLLDGGNATSASSSPSDPPSKTPILPPALSLSDFPSSSPILNSTFVPSDLPLSDLPSSAPSMNNISQETTLFPTATPAANTFSDRDPSTFETSIAKHHLPFQSLRGAVVVCAFVALL